MLKMANVSKVYRSAGTRMVALREASLEVGPGQLALLVGRSGSGKTTLLNIAGCLTRPTSGQVWLNGDEISSMPDHFLSDIRRHSIGFVFQQYNLLPGFTAVENVAMPLIPTGIGDKERIRRALDGLERVGLSERANAQVEQLSGGEQQRVALARALINDPKLILADEPTSNVDPDTEDLILSIFIDLIREGKIIIVASHDRAWIESGVASALYRVAEGRLSLDEREVVSA